MKVFLSRVSTEEQSELRQIQNVEGFDKVIIDKCSGLVDLWNRPNIVKNKIKKLKIRVKSLIKLHYQTSEKYLLILKWQGLSPSLPSYPAAMVSDVFHLHIK